MSERPKPGNLYIQGLLAIAEKNGVNLEEAAKIAEQDLLNVGGTEHLDPLHKHLNG